MQAPIEASLPIDERIERIHARLSTFLPESVARVIAIEFLFVTLSYLAPSIVISDSFSGPTTYFKNSHLRMIALALPIFVIPDFAIERLIFPRVASTLFLFVDVLTLYAVALVWGRLVVIARTHHEIGAESIVFRIGVEKRASIPVDDIAKVELCDDETLAKRRVDRANTGLLTVKGVPNIFISLRKPVRMWLFGTQSKELHNLIVASDSPTGLVNIITTAQSKFLKASPHDERGLL